MLDESIASQSGDRQVRNHFGSFSQVPQIRQKKLEFQREGLGMYKEIGKVNF